MGKYEDGQYWDKSGMRGWFNSSNRRPTSNQTRALEDGEPISLRPPQVVDTAD